MRRPISLPKLPAHLTGSGEEARAFRNTAWLLAEKPVRWLVAVGIGVWLARALGPADFGALSYALALAALFASFAGLGIENIIVRELVRTPADRDRLLGAALALRLIGGAVATLLTIATAWLMRGETPAMLAIIIALSLLASSGDILDLWFQATLQARRAAAARTGALLLAAAARAALLLARAPLAAFAWLAVAEAAFGSLALALAYRHETGHRPQPHFDPTLCRALLTESWPNIVSGFAMLAYMKVDRIMLAALSDAEAVGHYSAAATLTEAWYFLPVAIAGSATPMLTRLRATDAAGYYAGLGRLARLLSAIGWALALGLSVTAPWLAGTVYGARYADAAPTLAILAWGILPACLGVAASPWYLNEHLLVPAMKRHLLGAILNLALNFVFIPRWGGAGAAAATVISFASAHVLANALDPRTRVILRIQFRALLLLPPRSTPSSP